MKAIRWVLLVPMLWAVVLAAHAQPASGSAGCGPGMAGSAGAGSCRGGPGARGPGRGARWGSGRTSGWAMMSDAERREHAAQMRSFKSYDECKAYVDKHRETMVARAKELGRTMPAQPRRDACAGLKAPPK